MFKIKVPVREGIPFRQVAPRIWLTLLSWMDSSFEPMTISVSVVCQESLRLEVPKKAPSQTESNLSAVINIAPAATNKGNYHEDLEELAQMLGMEFGMPSPPSVGFTADS